MVDPVLKEQGKNLMKILSVVKDLSFTVEYFPEEDGSISGTVREVNINENAETQEKCCELLAEGLREFAQFYCEDIDGWAKDSPELFPRMLKVLLTNDKDLQKCLNGKI